MLVKSVCVKASNVCKSIECPCHEGVVMRSQTYHMNDLERAAHRRKWREMDSFDFSLGLRRLLLHRNEDAIQ